MAERRSIYKKISTSEKVARMCDRSKLFFTWSIPHADDMGILPFSQMSLKAKIFPMIDCGSDDIDRYIREIALAGLYKAFQFEDRRYWLITNFAEHQTLKRDRQPQTILPVKTDEKIAKSWQIVEEALNKAILENSIKLESIWNPDGTRLEPEVKGSEGKGSEIISTASRAELSVNDCLALFEPVNPTFERLYSNKTQRAAMDRLLKKFGPEKMASTLRELPKLINKPYAPTITTPLQLESKLGALISFYYKQKGNVTTIIGL